MEPFAKLFEINKIGQILVFKDTTDDGRPCIRVMYEATKLQSVATLSLTYSDTNEGEIKRDRIFSEITIEEAIKVISPLPYEQK